MTVRLGAWAVLVLWTAAAAGLFVAVLAAATAYGSYSYGTYLEDYGVRTQAYVDLEADVLTRKATVDFRTPNGYTYLTQVRFWMLNPPREAAEVTIVYDPSDPRDAMLLGSNENRVIAVFFAFGAAYATSVAVGAAAGALLVRR